MFDLCKSFLQAVPLLENNREPEMPGRQSVTFRRLPPEMLTTLSSQFEVFSFLSLIL